MAAIGAAFFTGLIADERDLVAEIEFVLGQSGINQVIHARSVDELVQDLSGRSLDAVMLVLDLEGSPRDVVAEARYAFPGVALLGIWTAGHQEEARAALRLGLTGLVLGDQLETALVPALEAVSAGLLCAPQPMRTELHRENLSSRERQILGMVVGGATNAEIAGQLFLAESTVKSHLSSAYEKLGVRTRKDAAALILDPAAGLDRGILAISA